MAAPTPLGTVVHLWRYPVKALRAESLEHIEVDADGLAGDRRAALFVDTPEHARSGKTYRGKEHALLHTVTNADAAVALGREAGLALSCRNDGPHFDARPVSVLFDHWLADAERLAAMPLEPLRYRPNVFVRGEPDFTDSEDALVDAILIVGSARLRVLEPIRRCVTTTYDVRTGEATPRVLEVVARERNNVMGIYCDVIRPGRLALGDAIVRDA